MNCSRSAAAVATAAVVLALFVGPMPLCAQSDAAPKAQKQEPKAAGAKKKAEGKAKAVEGKKAEPKKAEAKKAEPKKADAKKSASKSAAATGSAPIPLAERAAIQFDLNWTNHFFALADGEFNERTAAAVKTFQKDRGFRDTGVLTESEREALASAARNRRERVGWRMIEDRVSGAQLGLPTKLVTHESRGRSGTRWQTAQGQLQIETFRIREPGATLATVFEEQKRGPPNRQIATAALRSGAFVLTGMQGLKRFLVRAEIRNLEIRGVTVLYDQAIEATTDHIGLAVLSAFAPFPGTGVMALIAPPSRRMIEYGSGLVVTAAGHVLTDRQLTDGCDVLQIAGQGDASRIAERDSLALLRVFGAATLAPAALVHDGGAPAALTLLGIADPQMQNGERAASTATARINGDALDPPPPAGFAGAAALDTAGRVVGMVALKVPAAVGAAPPTAAVVPVTAIRQFLDAYYVTPSTGAAGVDAARASLVRVICLRR